MAIKVQMPKLSDTMEEGKILKWLKKEGDSVEQGEVLAEVESDKADMELEAFDSGTLLKIVVPEGKGAGVGDVIAVIGEEGENVDDLLKGDGEEKQEKKKETAEEDGTDEAAEGKRKEKEEESKEKGTTEEEKAGKDRKKDERESQKKETAESKPVEPSAGNGAAKASPLARKMADDHGISLKSIRGTGPEGRIVKRDIEKAIEEGVPETGGSEAVGGPTAQTIELTGMRKAIARRMVESKSNVPHFYLTVEIDMTRIIEARKRINEMQTETKVSFTDIIIKIAAQALLKHPRVNSYWAGDSIKRRGNVHIGLAVALEEGLITPVVRDCDRKGIVQISKEVKDYAERARNKKLKPEEYEGGGITISNLGMYDIEEFSAIINPPESAILATGTIVEKPVVRDGEITVGRTMRVTMSCDHRVVDGAVGAEYLRDFKRMLEDPIVSLI
jgi:pyruvate dehydrogenase E2 component (dihydrolipoamide acetyltransferase)